MQIITTKATAQIHAQCLTHSGMVMPNCRRATKTNAQTAVITTTVIAMSPKLHAR